MRITVETRITAPLEQVWRAYTTPADIMQWNAASDDWHTTSSQVDLREGGRFKSRMEARDGSFGFDFEGIYTRIIPHQAIHYTLAGETDGDLDGRTVDVLFQSSGDAVTVSVAFDAEETHPVEMQRDGWQAILDRFARHVTAQAGEQSP